MTTLATTRHGAWRQQPAIVAVTGMLSLAAALGIGRFAFTPLLPMMLHDGVLTLVQGSWLAMTNYLGYLLGAVLCTALPWVAPGFVRRWHPARMVRWGLVSCIALTAAMAWPIPAAWPALRLVAGVVSAVVFLNATQWCMTQLQLLGRPTLGGMIFCGPGMGIALTGLATSAMVAQHWNAASGWTAFAVLAVLLALPAMAIIQGRHEPATAAPATGGAPTPPHAEGPWDRALLTAAYGLAGLGYIVTATFLPVIARTALPGGSVWPDLFWPLFGVGVMAGAYLSTRLPARWDRRRLLVASYGMQAGSILICLLLPTRTGFALSSLLLGLPFTAITFFALQEARRIWPGAISSFPGLITAAYGVGQIVGPPMVAWCLAHSASEQQGFYYGLGAAALALVAGMGLYGVMLLRHPPRP
ncbi:YbfB/YjiJ family MFS transporter [Comamonas humi]